jgi:hypothetical protein
MKWRVEELQKTESWFSIHESPTYKVIETHWFLHKTEAYKFYHDNKEKKPLSYPTPVTEVKI